MLRLLHTADVHLGARHADLGERASLQRERQFTAFRASVDLAIAESVDLFLIAGDLFDSNTQPRRTVERVAVELGRLARASIRTVIIPGTHDVYDGASIYRAYDLAGMARAGADWIAVLTPDRPEIVFPSLDAVVYGRVFSTKRAPGSPLEGLGAGAERRATWRIGMIHGALSIPGKTDADEVVFTEDEIARSGLDYLALGHWHSSLEGRAGGVAFAYSGSPEPIAADQDGAGDVLLVTLDDRGGKRVSIEARRVGKTRCESLDLDVSGIESQPALIDAIARHADANTIMDVRLTGLFPDTLDLDLEEVARELATSFLRLRIRDMSIPGLSDEPIPPADTVLGAFIRIVEERIAALESGMGSSSEPAAFEVAEPSVSERPVAEQAVAVLSGFETLEAPPPADGNGASGGDHTNGELTATETEPVDEAVERAAPDGSNEAPAADATAEAVEPAEPVEPAPAVEAAARTEPVADTAPLEGVVPVAPTSESERVAAAAGAAPAARDPEQATLDELADLREVLRLGRHLLEGRHVTL